MFKLKWPVLCPGKVAIAVTLVFMTVATVSQAVAETLVIQGSTTFYRTNRRLKNSPIIN